MATRSTVPTVIAGDPGDRTLGSSETTLSATGHVGRARQATERAGPATDRRRGAAGLPATPRRLAAVSLSVARCRRSLMRTELIPAADVRIGDCVLDEHGAPAVVTSTRWQGVGGEWCRSRCPIIRTAKSSRAVTWWPVPSSSGEAGAPPSPRHTLSQSGFVDPVAVGSSQSGPNTWSIHRTRGTGARASAETRRR